MKLVKGGAWGGKRRGLWMSILIVARKTGDDA